MDANSELQGMQSSTTIPDVVNESVKQPVVIAPHPAGVVCFAVGVIALSTASVFVHGHPWPYPLDLQTTLNVQHLHPYAWVNGFIEFVSSLNNPTTTIVALALWLVGLISIGLIARFRGKSLVNWFQSAAGIV